MPVLPFEALPAPRQTWWGSTASTMPALEVRWQCWCGAAPVVNFRLGYQRNVCLIQKKKFLGVVNELVLTFSAPIKYAKAHFNRIILSRVIECTTYYYMQTDTFIKTVLSGSRSLKTLRFDENFKSHFSHKTNTFSLIIRI